MRIPQLVAAVAVIGLVASGPAGAALDPAIKCQAVKLKLAGKYASCRLIADANAVKNGTAPDYSNCDAKIQAGWQKVEESIGGECPTIGDLEDVQDSMVECLPSSRYLIRIGVFSTHTFGGLQIEVNYSQASGGFQGAGTDVSCSPSIPGTLNAYDDREDTSDLVLGVVAPEGGFESPIEAWTCIFENLSLQDPVESDFTLTVTDAVNPSGNPVVGVVPGIVIEKIP
jgi:hypothetical protein